MPGMDGGETYLKLKNLDRNVRVVLSSGYSLQGQAHDILKLDIGWRWLYPEAIQ